MNQRRSTKKKTRDPLPSSNPAPAARPVEPRLQGTEALGLALILGLAALLRIWHLDRNGFANTYYSAAVRSMLQSWHNFFFVSFDPAGWVTVDKPPLALWIQAASAKAFGFGSLSLLLPQAVEGVLGVALLFFMVRRAFDTASALGASLLLAITPVSVAADRYNNVDACLILVLLLAAFALSRAVESGRRSWLLAAAALLGLGFNTKMLAAFTILPVAGALALLGIAGPWRRRLKDLALAGAVLALVSLSWVAAVDLTPADQRPFVGSTQDNSMLGLTLGWNGLQRFTGRRHGPGLAEALTTTAGAGAALAGPADAHAAGATPATPMHPGAQTPGSRRSGHGLHHRPQGPRGAPGAGPQAEDGPTAAQAGLPGPLGGQRRGMGRHGFGGGMGAGEPGPTRLAQPVMAGQVLWFLPLALLGFVSALRRGRESGAQRPAQPAAPSPPQGRLEAWAGRALWLPLRLRRALRERPDRQALFLWGGWFLLCAVVLSALRTMHTYYLVLLAPPCAALGGIGLRALWLEYRAGRRDLLPVALLLTALWQFSTLAQAQEWNAALLPLLAGGAALSSLLLAWAPASPPRRRGLSWPRVGLATGLLALLACPFGWALTPVLSPTGDHAVEADPALLTGGPDHGGLRAGPGAQGGAVDRRLLAFLQEHRGRSKYLVAALNSQAVAPLIISSGEPAIAVGGFMGGDPIVTVDQFAQKVKAGDLRYFLLNAPRAATAGGPGRPGGFQAWTAGGPGEGGGPGGRNGASQLLDQWVRAHGRVVDPALWRTPQPKALYARTQVQGWAFGGRGGALQLYDLGPWTGDEGRFHQRIVHRLRRRA